MKKKILIIGNSAKDYALAKKLSEQHEVFVAPGSDTIAEFATIADIRENSVSELLEFVLENGIDLTIPTTQTALSTNIVEIFEKNNQAIFAPSQKAASLMFDKAGVKKILYKLRIPTPKFGIFEKQSMVSDYVKNLKSPFVIKTNEPSSAAVFASPKDAKCVIERMFFASSQKVIIEDYIWGTPFAFYTLTDGYKAIPIGSSVLYKHSLEGDGGQLTSGMGAAVPNYKLTNDNENFLMNNVIYPTLDYLEIQGCPYNGILGVNGIITEDGDIQILGYQTFMQDSDADGILEIIDSDLYRLFEACTLGIFSDEVEYIEQKNSSAVSLVLTCKNKENFQNAIIGLDNLEEDTKISFFQNIKKNRYLELEAQYGSVLVLTAFGGSITSAKTKVYNEAEAINFKGMTYRKDICKPVLSMI